MKAIHEAVQKELELQQMLKGAIREKEVGLRELQKMLLSALYIVNRLLDEKPPEAVAGTGTTLEPEHADPPAERDAAPAGISQIPVGPLESVEAPISDSSPRDLP
jgi:hypothetical protein